MVYALIYSNISICPSVSVMLNPFFGGYGGYAGTDHEFLMYPLRIFPSAGTAGTPI